jgi:hypothetical protein
VAGCTPSDQSVPRSEDGTDTLREGTAALSEHRTDNQREGSDDVGLSGYDDASREPNAAPEPGLATLAEWMTGSFSNASQAAANPAYSEIRLRIARIWPERRPGLWLYAEQWAEGQDQIPYRQRVFHLTGLSDSTFRSRTFIVPGSLRFAEQSKSPDPLRALSPDSLRAREGCDLLLVQRDSSFVGSSLGDDCRSELQGATHATSEVRITPHELYSWDRGFDESGTQVWGPITGGYEFRRVE